MKIALCYDADLCEYLLPDNSEEYAYVFRSGKWVCYDMHQWEDNKLPEVVEIPLEHLQHDY